MTEYEYEYFSVSQKWPNTNMNIFRFPKNDWIEIWILFIYPFIKNWDRLIKSINAQQNI